MRALAALCSSALVLSLPSPALAQADGQWILMATTARSNVYLDAASIRRTGGGIQFRQRTEFTGREDERSQTIALVEARCANRETRNVQSTVYLDDGRTVTSGAGAWQYVGPDTAGEKAVKFVCDFAS